MVLSRPQLDFTEEGQSDLSLESGHWVYQILNAFLRKTVVGNAVTLKAIHVFISHLKAAMRWITLSLEEAYKYA